MRRKEIIGMITFCIINILIAYLITTPLGIKDTVLYQSLTATNYTITYEVIIWFVLSLIEAVIYEKGIKKETRF